KYFTEADRDEVKDLLKSNLGKNPNQALLKVVRYTSDTMDRHHPPKPAEGPKVNPAQQPVIHPNNQVDRPMREHGMNNSWVGWVCMIVAVLVVVWVIFAIIRAIIGMFSGGYGGYGGGPGYGGGYGYGGGGFFTGMLGGLFGSMAGMWIYNNMFGGHAT